MIDFIHALLIVLIDSSVKRFNNMLSVPIAEWLERHA